MNLRDFLIVKDLLEIKSKYRYNDYTSNIS